MWPASTRSRSCEFTTVLLRRRACSSFPNETYALHRVELRRIECVQFLRAVDLAALSFQLCCCDVGRAARFGTRRMPSNVWNYASSNAASFYAQSILRHTASNCVTATSGELLVCERDVMFLFRFDYLGASKRGRMETGGGFEDMSLTYGLRDNPRSVLH